jgi:leader peptidase (prepilin peptidase)/N-methyltransferase
MSSGSAPLWAMVVLALPVVAAPFIGSFLGVLIRRLPAGRDVAWSRSCCDTCGHALAPIDLIPVLSFVALGGRCRSCDAPIARMHLAVELAAMLVPLSALAAGWLDPPALWTACALGWVLLALAWIDAISFLLPDVLTLPLLVAGLAQCWWRTPDLLADHALAAVVAWSALWLLAAASDTATGSARATPNCLPPAPPGRVWPRCPRSC